MFESKRLVYRKLDETDFDLFHALYSDEAVMRYAYLDRYVSLEESKKCFSDVLLCQDDPNAGTQYAVMLKGTNIAIGIVDYMVDTQHEKGGIFEIGYFIKPEYWGQGFGTEMGNAIIDYIFNNFNIHKVIASCNGHNRNSENIMLKLGMTKEGIFRKVRYKNGQWDDEFKYGLLKEDWLCQKQGSN